MLQCGVVGKAGDATAMAHIYELSLFGALFGEGSRCGLCMVAKQVSAITGTHALPSEVCNHCPVKVEVLLPSGGASAGVLPHALVPHEDQRERSYYMRAHEVMNVQEKLWLKRMRVDEVRWLSQREGGRDAGEEWDSQLVTCYIGRYYVLLTGALVEGREDPELPPREEVLREGGLESKREPQSGYPELRGVPELEQEEQEV